MTTFAPALNYYRTRAGLSVRALSYETGVYHQAIMRLERGERHPRRETVDALAEALSLGPLDADRLRLAAGFAPCDLVGLVLDGVAALAADTNPVIATYAGRANEALRLLRLNLIFEARSLDAICREVAP